MSVVGPDFDFEARLPLIQKLDELNNGVPVSIDYWAIVWMSDLDSLRAYVDEVEQIPFIQKPLVGDAVESTINYRIVAPWNGKVKPRGATSSTSTPALSVSPTHKRVKSNPIPSSSLASSPPNTPTKASRDSKLPAQVRERDNGCVISKVSHPKNAQIAHIYPISMSTYIDDPIRRNTWDYLKLFYPEAEVESWRTTLLQSGKTERLENLISMAPTIHYAWDSCQFALFPISPSSVGEKEIKVQFFWMKIRQRADRETISLTQIPDLPSDCPAGLGGLLFLNCQTREIIKSGDIITLTTPDPDKYPLPSVELLRMQWHLNRIGALAGGAEAIDIVGDDYDIDLDYGVCIVNDESIEEDQVEDHFEVVQPPSPSQKAIGQHFSSRSSTTLV